MNANNLARTTFVLSRSVHEDLNYLSKRTRQSRSALVREVLEPSIIEMARALRKIPEKPTLADLEQFKADALRFMDDVHAEGERIFRDEP